MARRTIVVWGLALLAGILLGLAPLGRSSQALGAEPGATQAGHAAPTETGSHEEPQPLEPQAPLAIWTIVVFVGLMLVLWKFAWKPLAKALHEREERMEHTLQEVERAREESERLLCEHRKQMADAADQVRALIEQAHRDAETTASEIISKAHGEAESALHRAQREIVNAKDEALVELWNKAAELAVSVAGKVLTRELSAEEHHRLIARAIEELPAAPAGTNGHGGGGHA